MPSPAAIRRVTSASAYASTRSRVPTFATTTSTPQPGGRIPGGPGGQPGGFPPGARPTGARTDFEIGVEAIIAAGYTGCISLGLPKAVCDAAAALVGGLDGGETGGGKPGSGGGGGGPFDLGALASGNCDEGFVFNPTLGICEFEGSPGQVTTQGTSGLPPGAARAVTVGEIHGRPIRRCPAKFVLADPALFGPGVCFHKSTIPNKLRKWPKTAKPPVTAYDARMMRKYGPGGSKQKSIKKLAGSAGLSCKRK